MSKTTETLDEITRQLSAFRNFEALLDTAGSYRPTIYPETADHNILADAYDQAQEERGDTRRAFRGSPRKGVVRFVRGDLVEVLVDGEWILGRVGGAGTGAYNVDHADARSFPGFDGGKIRTAPKGAKLPRGKCRPRGNECGRCGGKGAIRGFGHVLGGVCFSCEGTGKRGRR